MIPVNQKRNIKINVYINKTEEKLLEQYIADLAEYKAVSEIFRTSLIEKIKNEIKDKN